MSHDPIIELSEESQQYIFDCRTGSLAEGFGLQVVGYAQLAGHYRVAQQLAFPLLEITLSGEGWSQVAGRVQRLRSGDILCVPAGTPYELRTLEGDPWEKVFLLLDQDGRELNLPRDVTRYSRPEVVTLRPLMQQLQAEQNRRDLLSSQVLSALSQLIGLQLRRLLSNEVPSGLTARLQQVIQQVQQNLAYPWSTEELARRLGCSRAQLHRLFSARLGRSPMQHIEWLRLQRASYWLQTTPWPLKLIADRLGYENPYHFSTAFKRRMGLSPTHYRQRHSLVGPPRPGIG